jgi:hypothetical protein
VQSFFFAHKRIEVSSGIILFHPFSPKKMPLKLDQTATDLAAGFLISSDAAEQLGGFHSA